MAPTLHPLLPAWVAARRRIDRHGWRTWLHRERQPIVDTLKVTAATALAWVVSSIAFPNQDPILAPLTAMLTVQVTAKATVVRGAQQVSGVVVGVLAAFSFTHALGFHAWSLAIIVFASLLVGRGLRLGGQATQVATTGLLVLSLGVKGTSYAGDRLLTTLIGAAVGVVVTLVTPSRRDLIAAAVALAGVADDTGDLLTDMGRGLRAGDAAGTQVPLWLHRARFLNHELADEQELRHSATDGSRLEPRAFRDPDRLAQFHHAGKVVAHNVGHVETLANALYEWTELRAKQPTPTLTQWLSGPVADLIDALGSASEAFGRIQRLPPHAARQMVDDLRAAVATAEALQVNAEVLAEVTDRRAWPVAGSVIEATGAMLAELDPDKGRHAGACPFVIVVVEGSGAGVDHC
jgi:hypothetical protein